MPVMRKLIFDNRLFEQARTLEQKEEPEQAVAVYQQMYNKVPDDRRVINRLLILYRKLKSYKKELQLINNTIKRNKDALLANRNAWVKANRKMAKLNLTLGRSLNILDAKGLPVYEEPFIQSLKKRQTFVRKRLKMS
jgi:tetratricopeptide (TPR) repeat protein